jgi:hypothetical protein
MLLNFFSFQNRFEIDFSVLYFFLSPLTDCVCILCVSVCCKGSGCYPRAVKDFIFRRIHDAKDVLFLSSFSSLLQTQLFFSLNFLTWKLSLLQQITLHEMWLQERGGSFLGIERSSLFLKSPFKKTSLFCDRDLVLRKRAPVLLLLLGCCCRWKQTNLHQD